MSRASLHCELYAKLKQVSLYDWIQMVSISAEHPRINGILFPGFPSSALQVSMVGSAGAQTIQEVALLYRYIHAYANKAGLQFDEQTRVLDFGCGFGRLLRLFMKDVSPGNLIGTDVDASFIATCKELFHGGDFHVNSPYPPLCYSDSSFDIIYAYSVFTHLSEAAHLQWLQELHRLIKPGGLVFLTLRQKEFLLQCYKWRTALDASAYEQGCGKDFGDLDTVMSKYIRGEYIYPEGRSGGGVRTSDFYGDTVISPKYIKQHWGKYFLTVDLFDDLHKMAQALIVLKPNKKISSGETIEA